MPVVLSAFVRIYYISYIILSHIITGFYDMMAHTHARTHTHTHTHTHAQLAERGMKLVLIAKSLPKLQKAVNDISKFAFRLSQCV